MSSNRSLELATVLGVSLLLAAVAVLLTTPPARQYEISIYRAYPSYFWGLLVGAFILGGLVILASARRPGDQTWQPALALVLLSNAVLLFMPFIRGYQMYGRADPMTHVGFTRDILSSGEIGGNIYPPVHLLVMTVADATGVDLMTITMLIPPVFSMLYFGSMFYLLRTLFDSRQQVLFGLPFVLLPVLRFAHLGLRPFGLSILLVPLTFYLFFKGQRNPVPAVRAAFVVVLFAQLLYHPLTALFLIGVFTLYLVSRYAPRIRKQYVTPTNLFSLSLVVFLAWYSRYTGIILRFERIYFTLFGSSDGEAPVEAYQGTIQEASPALIDLVRVATFKYGLELTLFGLGFASLGLALLLLRRREYAPDLPTVMLGTTLAVFSVGGLVFLVTDLIVPPRRPFQIAKIGAVVLTGQLLYLLRDRVDWARNRLGTTAGFWVPVVVVLLLLVTLSTFSLYESPLKSENNPQVTKMEMEGSMWLTQHGNETDDLARFGLPYHRFYDARFGANETGRFSEAQPPSHFNYTTRQYLGQSYDSDRYLTLTRKGRIVYPELFPDYPSRWRFTPRDFERFERDRTTDRVYDNGDYTQYVVNSTAE